ncbi:response regulator [Chloracidobacterium sp. D]|uniref:response regulator n=1 Tax=Chloracidobacterium sp. D TaxID=2821536 RepID=UPI0035300C6E
MPLHGGFSQGAAHVQHGLSMWRPKLVGDRLMERGYGALCAPHPRQVKQKVPAGQGKPECVRKRTSHPVRMPFMTLPYVSPAETSSLSSARILVVDDEPLIRQSIGEALQKQGHQVALAADGRDALEQLGTATFELVVCDIRMPHMDGIELCRLVRSDPRTAAIPFLFLSAY